MGSVAAIDGWQIDVETDTAGELGCVMTSAISLSAAIRSALPAFADDIRGAKHVTINARRVSQRRIAKGKHL